MKLIKFVLWFFLLSLTTQLFAFNVEDYLINNETKENIKKEFFTLNHITYTIINISGKSVFLLKGEELLTKKDEIENVFKIQYLSKYLINQNETNLLKSYLTTYNISRNNGGIYPNNEEELCKNALMIHLYPCTDDKSCNITAVQFHSVYHRYVGNAPATFLPHIQNFSYASIGTDAILNNVFDKLDKITDENTVEYVAEIKANISTLEKHKTKIEGTIFRIPSPGQKCSECYGICADIDLDDAALNNAKTLIDTLSKKVAPLNEYKSLAETIYTNTLSRIEEYNKSKARAYYLSIYTPMNALAKKVKNETKEALLLVNNESIKAKLTQLENMETEILSLINANNFTTVNETIIDYFKAINSLNASVEPLVNVYKHVSAEHDETVVYIFLAESKILTQEDTKTLNILKQKKLDLDKQFKKGLSATQYSKLQEKYAALIQEGRTLIEKSKVEQTIYMFTGMANKFVDAFDIMSAQLRPLTYYERTQSSYYLPYILSALLFVSFFSLVLFLFLIHYATAPKPISKGILIALTFVLAFVLALVSVSVYFSSDKALNKLDYFDFMNLLVYSKNTTILVQANNNSEIFSSIKICASSIANRLSEKGISSTIYILNGTSCTLGNTNITVNATVQNCLDKISNPSIILNFDSAETSSYSGLLMKRAIFTGDKEYYDICPFAKAAKIY